MLKSLLGWKNKQFSQGLVHFLSELKFVAILFLMLLLTQKSILANSDYSKIAMLESEFQVAMFEGNGFDTCSPPQINDMAVWILESPYKVVNLYGGQNWGCRSQAGRMTKEYVSKLSDQGWKFIPTWVGLQATCYQRNSTKMHYDPSISYQQGRNEADLAIGWTKSLGLAGEDGSGTIIYYDLEGHPGGESCRTAAKEFIKGWTERLHQYNSLSGVYGSVGAAYIKDFAEIDPMPDAVWPARNIRNSFDNKVTVWDLEPYLNDRLWSNHQRIVQYTGGHQEKWGNVTLNIDSNKIDGMVVSKLPNQSSNQQSLSGKTIVINPGHGRYEDDGKDKQNRCKDGELVDEQRLWCFQRNAYWGIREDLVTSEIAKYLIEYLEKAGAKVYSTRGKINDEKFLLGTKDGAQHFMPLWQMSSREYFKKLGINSTIWDSATSGANYDKDINSRPLYADTLNADMMISLHTNGCGPEYEDFIPDSLQCWKSGTTTFIWHSNEKSKNESSHLANLIHNKLVETLKQYSKSQNYSWNDNGIAETDDKGELKVRTMPSVLVEALYHTRYAPDNYFVHNDEVKKLIAKSIYFAILEYFSVDQWESDGICSSTSDPDCRDGICYGEHDIDCTSEDIILPIPQPITTIPSPPPPTTTCPQSSPGIILYTDRNYAGTCVRLLDGKYNLADFKIDNDVSSIWINGNYTVKMWGGANQSPSPGEEFSKSDDNIDDKSLGEQWSSIEITTKSKDGSCPKDGRSGVYFYKDKDFKGACVYSTGDIKDFSPTSIGNNSTSSARIVGDWEVTVFDSQNLKGKTYKFTSSQSNLDDKADVGSDISSARVRPRTKVEAPIPACPAPLLLQPTSGASFGSRTLAFSWGGVVCERSDGNDSYRLRIKSAPSMESGGEMVYDALVNGGSQSITLDPRWERLPLYWSVQVGNAKNGAAWSHANLLTVDANQPPTVAIQEVNGQVVSNDEQFIWSNQSTLDVKGSAADADGTVVRVDVTCSGQSCNMTTGVTPNASAWSYQQANIDGRTEIDATAIDNLGKTSSGEMIDGITLWVDRSPPQTGIVLNNNANPANWPTWFTDPVVVYLAASDEGSGSGANLARAGVKELRYRLDGGEWQTQTGDQLYLEINSSGVHTLEYYALDNVGNAETVHSQTISIDLLPPGLPTNLSESNGVVNDLWQNSQYRPSFMWNPASDEHSGVWGYQFYFGDDPTGEGYHTVQVGEPRSWIPQENGVTTGVYYLRGRTRDQAGNWSDWATLFTFRYDKTAPSNPSQGFHANGISSERWQRVTSSGLFTWTSALDEGAGVEGYFVYWGNDANGESGNFITVDAYQSATPLCAQGQSCSGYLRLRARDKVGNLSPNWSTAFVLRYDTKPPALDFTINGGASESNSVFVTLFLNASDAGSGVAQMQLSPDGVNWPTQWLTYTTTSPWTISGISGQNSTVYVRVRDGVGNESAVVSRSIRFEANIPQPQSTNFVLFNSTFAAGGGEQISPQYWLHSTVAEPPDSPPMVSTNYLLLDGYEAGGVATTSVAPTPTPTPPQPTCNEPPLVIDNGAAFTGQRQVLLRFCAKQAVAMQVSDNAGFSGAQWESFTVTKSFTLAAPVAAVAPLYAYVRFRSADGNEQGAFADFIYFDTTQPSQPEIYVGDSIAGLEPPATVRSATADSTKHTILIGPHDLVDDTNAVNVNQVLAASSEAGTITGAAIDIYVNNQDDLAGIEAIQLSERADFADATWQSIPSNSRLDWAILGTDGDKSLYARVQDKAGNVSTSAFATFTVDLTAPTGGITLEPHIVAASTDEVNIYLAGYDNLSGVSEMRLNTDPLLLQGDLWRPYTTSLTIPAYLPLAGELPIYVQFRDLVGNVSDIYSDTYLVDLEPPSIEVEVEAGTSLTRKLLFYGYDGMTEITSLRLSNDLSTLADVTPIPFSSEILWQFDERRVVWVQAEDRMGNRSEAIPVYADSIQVPVPTIQIYLPLINR